MGIDVSPAKVVTFNPQHQQRVITDPVRKPPVQSFGKLEVVSIFARRRVRHDSHDGNPLIYALKGKFGYTMPYRSFRDIYDCVSLILPQSLEGIEFDVIVSLPSSSKVAAIFAKRASRCGGRCPIVSCLDKATFGEVLKSAPPPEDVERRFRAAYKSQHHVLQKENPAHIFQMKHVKLPFRPYFTPVIANHHGNEIKGHRVLLVDDILGSGTSIAQAAVAISPYQPLSVVGLTLMGQLR